MMASQHMPRARFRTTFRSTAWTLALIVAAGFWASTASAFSTKDGKICPTNPVAFPTSTPLNPGDPIGCEGFIQWNNTPLEFPILVQPPVTDVFLPGSIPTGGPISLAQPALPNGTGPIIKPGDPAINGNAVCSGASCNPTTGAGCSLPCLLCDSGDSTSKAGGLTCPGLIGPGTIVVRDDGKAPAPNPEQCTGDTTSVLLPDQLTWLAKNGCPVPNTAGCDDTLNTKQDNDVSDVSCAPPPPPVDDYKCYQIKPANLRFRFESFRLAYLDQFSPFGPRDPLVVRPNELCTPVNKNAENPDAPESPNHLVCYKVADLGHRVPLLSVTDTDQFGSEDLNIGNDAEVCLPAVKNCTGTGCTSQLAEVERELSHLACYQARSAGAPLVPPGQRTVSLEDQFGSTTGTIGPVNFHCNPMFSKTIEDGPTEQLNVAKFGKPPSGAFWEEGDTIHYKCYGLTDNTRTSTTATILDQFESLAIRVGRATRLCEPAVKVLNTPLPPP